MACEGGGEGDWRSVKKSLACFTGRKKAGVAVSGAE